MSKTKEEILKEFDENVFGDCFAGGTFVDNEKQAMYTSGFKEGFNKAKNMSKQFLIKAIAQTREETIREVGDAFPKEQDDDIDYNSLYMDGFNSGYKSYRKKVLDILNKLKK